MKESKKKKSTGKEVKGEIMDNVTESGNELGTVKIHENVIASVIRRVTLSVAGVARLSGSTLVDNIAEIVGSRKIHDRAISVEIEESTVKVVVKVNIEFGAHIPTVAGNIQKSVIDEVGKSTGMKVSQVDVIIQEIEEVKPEEPEVVAEEESEEE